MLQLNTASYRELRGYLDTVPVIETHEHYTHVGAAPAEMDYRSQFGYYWSDLLSSSFGLQSEALAFLENIHFSFEDRLSVFDSGWIDMQAAKAVAADWFFNNPNEFFKLGFERYTP